MNHSLYGGYNLLEVHVVRRCKVSRGRSKPKYLTCRPAGECGGGTVMLQPSMKQLGPVWVSMRVALALKPPLWCGGVETFADTGASWKGCQLLRQESVMCCESCRLIFSWSKNIWNSKERNMKPVQLFCLLHKLSILVPRTLLAGLMEMKTKQTQFSGYLSHQKSTHVNACCSFWVFLYSQQREIK